MSERSDEVLTFEREIHERLLAGDPLAASELCMAYLERLCNSLRATYRSVDFDHVYDAVVDALFGYIERPQQYQPEKRSLFGYLRMSAEGDLRNLLRKLKHHLRELPLNEDVEIPAASGNTSAGEGESPEAVLESLTAAECRQRLLAIAQSDEERIVLELMLDGERDTSVFLDRLGWQGPRDEASKRLYRIKDRLVKRAQRSLEVCNG